MTETENDKGCCCCCPSFIGVILLAVWEAIILLVSIYYLMDDILEERYWLVWQVIVFAAQIFPFASVFIWSEKWWPRLVLFIFQVIALIWTIIFFSVALTHLYPGLCAS